MCPGAERYDLHGDGGLLAGIKQVLQLALHDCRAANPAVQRLLTENGDHFGGVCVSEQILLPLQSHVDDTTRHLVAAVHPEQLEGVFLRLQQAWDEKGMENAD